MTISAAFPTQAKLDALVALCPPGNTYKVALYTSAAVLSAATTVYTASGEVVGTGYTAGGQTLTGIAQSLDTTTAIMDFADPSWASATITARGAMIYDSTNGNKARAVLDFGADVTSTNGTFLVTLPAPAAASAVIRLA
jgi:O-acetylhomoserine/O-acetylserine sulfhydrylase-like pyridoxal-dependent enzyme